MNNSTDDSYSLKNKIYGFMNDKRISFLINP